MYSKSTLSHTDAVSALELFEQGYTAKSVAISLDLAQNPVHMLYQRWQLRGAGALVTRDRRQYDFETKLEIVRRNVNGESEKGSGRRIRLTLAHNGSELDCHLPTRRRGRVAPEEAWQASNRSRGFPSQKRDRDTAHGERTTSRRSRVPGKITGLEVAGTTGESSSCRRSQGALPAVPLAADRGPPQIDVLRPSESTPSRGPPC